MASKKREANRLPSDAGLTFYEFFAGGGMARCGLGEPWTCVFANDFDDMKASTYVMNWGDDHFVPGDVAKVKASELPGTADLAWASFPCQDLSLAGDYRGLGRASDNMKTRSGTFWLFWNKILDLKAADRQPKTIVLENVYGTLTSHDGQDFSAIASAVSSAGYHFGAIVFDAKRVVPQSRPRVFIICVRNDLAVPHELVSTDATAEWHPEALVDAYNGMTLAAKKNWIWWNLSTPSKRTINFADIVDDDPVGVDWHSKAETAYVLSLMTDVNLAKVTAAKKAGRRMVGAIYRRTRPDENGVKKQRAEVRFDEIAGCLRTPRGGSSRQSIILIDGKSVRTRLLSPREAARLMGLPETYRLPARYNDAYHVCGDGVVVPVVRHLAKGLLEPILLSRSRVTALAAE